jgi:hypothetical protein
MQWGLRPERVAVWVLGGRLAQGLWPSSGTASNRICSRSEEQGDQQMQWVLRPDRGGGMSAWRQAD